jgi:hypothetical protein
MSSLALFIAGSVLVPVVVGVATGAIMRPHEPWKDTPTVAAVGSGVIGGFLAAAIVVVMIIHPTECIHAKCHETDTQAGAQIAFLALLLVPIYALVLPGAAIGKLLGRAIRSDAGHSSSSET